MLAAPAAKPPDKIVFDVNCWTEKKVTKGKTIMAIVKVINLTITSLGMSAIFYTLGLVEYAWGSRVCFG